MDALRGLLSARLANVAPTRIRHGIRERHHVAVGFNGQIADWNGMRATTETDRAATHNPVMTSTINSPLPDCARGEARLARIIGRNYP
jgi:hypothetical protein